MTTTTTGKAACGRCQPPCTRIERCDMCGGGYFHDYVHWNGAFYQCEHCSALEHADPAQNGLDPIFGGTFSQHMRPVYEPYAPMLASERVPLPPHLRKASNMTTGTTKGTPLIHDGEQFGVIIGGEEFAAMTADQLREAIRNYGRVVIRDEAGAYNLADLESGDYDY
jgi:hypothetical protein